MSGSAQAPPNCANWRTRSTSNPAADHGCRLCPPTTSGRCATQVGEALFRLTGTTFARVAALSKAVPGAVAAKLTEVVLPPLIAARTAECSSHGAPPIWSTDLGEVPGERLAVHGRSRALRSSPRSRRPGSRRSVPSSPAARSGWSWAASSRR